MRRSRRLTLCADLVYAVCASELEDEDLGEFLQGSDEDIDHDDVERKAGDQASVAARLLATPTLWLSSNSTQQWSAGQCGADHSPGGTVISQVCSSALVSCV